MWSPKRIEIYNLFAHIETKYEFRNGVCTVIFGENKTDNGSQNNGAGKSTIFEAMLLALTNKTSRDLNKEAFINYDAENCRIVFCLENKTINKTLEISRQFFRGGKSVKVELKENGEVNKNIVSVDEANKRIIELIGVSREDLLRYFIISQDNHYTFFTAGDVEKKEVLNRITSADMINPLILKLKDDEKSTTSKISDLNIDSERLTTIRNTVAEQRQEILDNDNTEEEVKEIKDKIKIIETKILSLNQTKSSYDIKLKNIISELSKKSLIDISLLKKKRKELDAKIEELQDQISEDKNVLRNINNELNSVVVCPNCKAEFINKSELGLSLSDAKILKTETENAISDNKSKEKVLQDKLDDVKIKISNGKENNEHIDDLNTDKKSLTNKIQEIDDEVGDKNERIDKLNKNISTLKNKKKDNKLIKTLDEKISKTDLDLKDNSEKTKEFQSKLEMIQYWIYYMGKAGFQTYLANRSISVIEGITNSFLKKFNSDLTVSINGFKILKDGSVREKIEVFASTDGMTSNVFMAKSGGERGRINLAGVLGIQHLINMSTNGLGLDFLALDESFAGIDSMGQENIIKILEGLGITVMMITQNVSSEFNSDNKLMIVKENGVSKIL